MTSHTYQLTRRDWVALTVPPLAPILLFTAFMHAGAWMGLLPSPRPATDVDRTIILHQADASRAPQTAQWLLLGDSSCLMNVDAQQLTEALAAPVLNLGTSSYLDLNAYSVLAGEYARSHPGHPATIVLLMHPEALRRSGGEAHQTRLLFDYLEQKDTFASHPPTERLKGWIGLSILEGRVLSRVLPHALPGAFGRAYGFTHDLESYMSAHQGSLLEPSTAAPSGNPDYALHPSLEKACARFRSSLPSGTRLMVGITPLPETFAAPDYPTKHRQLLDQWARWIGANTILESLPATMPDSFFATKTHLNEPGVRDYTRRLAQPLAAQGQ